MDPQILVLNIFFFFFFTLILSMNFIEKKNCGWNMK